VPKGKIREKVSPSKTESLMNGKFSEVSFWEQFELNISQKVDDFSEIITLKG
jgi:hypothetical protein